MRLSRPHAFGVCFASSYGDFEGFAPCKAGAFDRILTGTAIALVLGACCRRHPGAGPEPVGDRSRSSRCPSRRTYRHRPRPISGPRETTGSTAINLPDPPDLPPPTFKDIAVPAPAPEAAPATVATPAPAPATVATPAPVPAPPPVVVAAPDQPLRDAIRELVSSKLTRFIDRKSRPHRRRGVLFLARLRAALGRRRRGKRARQAGDRAPQHRRCRRAWIRPTIRRRSSRLAPIRPRWPTPKCASPLRR